MNKEKEEKENKINTFNTFNQDVMFLIVKEDILNFKEQNILKIKQNLRLLKENNVSNVNILELFKITNNHIIYELLVSTFDPSLLYDNDKNQENYIFYEQLQNINRNVIVLLKHNQVSTKLYDSNMFPIVLNEMCYNILKIQNEINKSTNNLYFDVYYRIEKVKQLVLLTDIYNLTSNIYLKFTQNTYDEYIYDKDKENSNKRTKYEHTGC
jgi:hypothetical protein